MVIIAVIAVGSVAAAILSNLLVLGPYNANGNPITISATPSSQVASCGSSNATVMSFWNHAAELPLPSGNLNRSIWYKTGIRVQAPSGTSFNGLEFYNVTYTGTQNPSAGDLKLIYCDLTINQWVTLTPSFSGNVWSGTVTSMPFVLPANYDATTPVLVSVLQPGNYTLKLWFSSA